MPSFSDYAEGLLFIFITTGLADSFINSELLHISLRDTFTFSPYFVFSRDEAEALRLKLTE